MELDVDTVNRALTDNRTRWKYVILNRRSNSLTEDDLNAYGHLGWEIASVTEIRESDQWGNTWNQTTIIFKYPYTISQNEIDNGQS